MHTLHLQAMGIESAQVGGPCGCTRLGVVRGARPGRAQTAGSWLPAVSRALLCPKTAGSWATGRLQKRAAQHRPIHSTALQPWPRLGTYRQAKALLPSGYPMQVTAGQGEAEPLTAVRDKGQSDPPTDLMGGCQKGPFSRPLRPASALTPSKGDPDLLGQAAMALTYDYCRNQTLAPWLDTDLTTH